MTTEKRASALAYKNERFLDSDEARPLRILAEYLEPLESFRRQGVKDTVAFLGSARLTASGPLGIYYDAARQLSGEVTRWASSTLGPGRLVVCTGGGGGIMEAANRGAVEAGGKTVGLNISLPHEQRPNPYVTPELCFEFHYFFMRKLWFAHLARAIVVFPGGLGTLDELAEILTLAQTGKLDRSIVILLYGSSYWREIVNFAKLAEYGMISAGDVELFQFVDTPAAALDALKARLSSRETVAAEAEPAFAKSRTSEQD